MGVAGHVTLRGSVWGPKMVPMLSTCLSKNEKSWQTKQEKMIKAQNEARSQALNHSSWTDQVSSLFIIYNNCL